MRCSSVAPCALIGVTLCSGLWAGEWTVQKLFADADASVDGRLDTAEHRHYLELAFDQDEVSGDGVLDRRELAQSMARSSHGDLTVDSPQIQLAIASTFPTMNKDGNGRLSRKEAVHFSAQSFVASDSNGDGVLSLAEMRAMTPGR